MIPIFTELEQVFLGVLMCAMLVASLRYLAKNSQAHDNILRDEYLKSSDTVVTVTNMYYDICLIVDRDLVTFNPETDTIFINQVGKKMISRIVFHDLTDFTDVVSKKLALEREFSTKLFVIDKHAVNNVVEVKNKMTTPIVLE